MFTSSEPTTAATMRKRQMALMRSISLVAAHSGGYFLLHGCLACQRVLVSSMARVLDNFDNEWEPAAAHVRRFDSDAIESTF